MAWGMNTWDIPRVQNFAAAAKIWADAKPWRNQHESWRQLEARRAYHKRVVKLSDDEGYQLVLHQTPLVTYYTNGNLALQTYDSVSTIDFAHKVRPTGFEVESVQGIMYWGVPTEDGMKYVRPKHTTLHLALVRPDVYQISSYVVEDFEWKLDLKRAAAVRKKLSRYDRWQKLTSRLTNTSYLSRHIQRRELYHLLAEPDNTALFPALGMPITDFLRDAYEIEGARYKVPVPMGQLPKVQK